MHLTEVYILAHPELKDSREAEGPYINLRKMWKKKAPTKPNKISWKLDDVLFLLPWSHVVVFFWRKIVQFTGSPNDADANSFWGSRSQKRQDTSEKTTELLLWVSSVGKLYPLVIEFFLILFESPSMGTLLLIDQDVKECVFFHDFWFYSQLNDDLSSNHGLLSPASLER